MNVYKHIEKLIKNKLQSVSEIADALGEYGDAIVVEVPKNRVFGDFSTNAAMVLARPMKSNPRAVAEKIIPALAEIEDIESLEVAGPGFINIRVKAQLWDRLLDSVVSENEAYGTSDIGQHQKFNVEFLSANPTGPLHIGHARGAILGDVLSRLLQKIGYDVTKEYYINDYGNQINTLAHSLYRRYEECFGRHQGEAFPEGCYPGEYLLPVARKLAEKDGDKWLDKPETDWLAYFKETAVADMMELIKASLAKINIVFDVFTSEKYLVENHKVKDTLDYMAAQGLTYVGVLPKPKGEENDDWTPEKQLLFKSTEFGDDIDRVLARANGVTTYFASDIAYHMYKFERGFAKQLDVWGADHGGYVKRIKSALSAVSGGKADLEIRLCQIVNLEKDGKPFRMSKRAGNFVMIEDVLDEIDADAFRLFMIMKSADSQMNFDLAKAKEQTKDNPVFYIQYAHARANSVLKKYADTFGEPVNPQCWKDAKYYADAAEIEKNLIKSIADYPSTVEAAALGRAPQILTAYLEELARQFHSLWTAGGREGIRFIYPENRELSTKRMYLVAALKNTIANGLQTLGVEPKESMENIKEASGE